MRNRSLLALFLFLSGAGSTYCQKSDFGLWYVVNSEKSLNKKFDLEASASVRTFDNGSKIDQSFFEFTGSYRINKNLGFAVAYRIGNYVENDDRYHIRHKWFGDIKGTMPVSHIDFSLRMRLQITDKTWVERETDRNTSEDLRIRVKGNYKTPDFPVNPYISIETFSPLFRDSGLLVDKSRSTVGVEFKINKNNDLDLDYTYQRDHSPDLSVIHIIALSYDLKF